MKNNEQSVETHKHTGALFECNKYNQMKCFYREREREHFRVFPYDFRFPIFVTLVVTCLCEFICMFSFRCWPLIPENIERNCEYSMNSEKWKMMSCTTIYFNYCKKLFVLKWMDILNMISSGIILNFGVSSRNIPGRNFLLYAQICIQINEREVEQRMLLIVTKFSSIQSFLNELHFFPRNNNVSFNGWSRFSLVILWKEQIRKSTNSLLNPPYKTL